ncbi:CRISPR-associated protein Csx16 [Bisgaardia hudsonensis]|uniref:CRISPR-associated protein Csx16 n=1 Tax=Bisgaardia hudsonensis TaxID=109472 RepID=UPI003C7CD680
MNDIQAGDIVIGTLPIHIAEQVCAKKATFYFLSVNVSQEQRGQELTSEQLVQQGCSIQPYYIQKL